MSQADGYVRIVTQNDVSEAQRSTEQLGDTIQEALDTTPADNMTNAMGSLEDGISDTGDAALKTGDIIKANLVLGSCYAGNTEARFGVKGCCQQCSFNGYEQ